ncbi:MAG: helix-turn-helix transcriptional regulator [Gaiellaceae bacterium]
MRMQEELQDPKLRRYFEEELLIAETTDTIEGLLTSLDLNQKELAHRLGVSEARVSQILSGENVTLRSLAAVGWALGIRMELEPIPMSADDRVGTPAVSDRPAPAWLGRLREEEARYRHQPEIIVPNLLNHPQTFIRVACPIDVATAA